MTMQDSPEITTLEFGASHTISSAGLIGLYVDHESACNRFKVRELNTGGQEWTLSDLQPLYGHCFSGGDLEIKVASPIVGDTFAGYSGSRVLLIRKARSTQTILPNLPLVPTGRPSVRVVRQIVRKPAGVIAAFTMSRAYIEGYVYVSCTFAFNSIINIAGASWRISGRGQRAEIESNVDSPQVFLTTGRAVGIATGNGNAAPSLTDGGAGGWDLQSVAVEPFALAMVEAELLNVPIGHAADPPGSIIWQFSNVPMTERF